MTDSHVRKGMWWVRMVGTYHILRSRTQMIVRSSTYVGTEFNRNVAHVPEVQFTMKKRSSATSQRMYRDGKSSVFN